MNTNGTFCPSTTPDGLFRVEHAKFEGNTAEVINSIGTMIHALNQKWWVDPATGLPKTRNVGEMLMLIVTELAEALKGHEDNPLISILLMGVVTALSNAIEGHRKAFMDDHLPHRKMIEVELADAVIRIFDMANGMGLDLGGAIQEKLQYNITRADHQISHRLQPGGKAY